MVERQIEHRKTCSVLSARFFVLNWPSRSVDHSNSSCNRQEPGSLLHGAMNERFLERDPRTRGGCPGGGGGWGRGVVWYPYTPVLTLDTLSFSYLILDIPLIMLWGKTQLYRKECSRTPVDRLFDGVLLPFTIVVKFVVAGKRNQTSETNAEWEKNLRCSIDPNLKYNRNPVYVKEGNTTVLLCKWSNLCFATTWQGGHVGGHESD